MPFVLVCCLVMSCRHRGDVDIEYRESERYYSMDAWFHEYQTRNVEEYIDEKIGRQSDLSFVNTRIDGSVALDNHVTFLMKKSPGHIWIELDKRKNSVRSYREIKSMCEGIKQVLK